MKTNNPITGQRERGFVVIVSKIKGIKAVEAKPKDRMSYNWENHTMSCYPFFNGHEAIANMKVLAERGFDSVAYTEANGVKESLTLEEMTKLYIPQTNSP